MPPFALPDWAKWAAVAVSVTAVIGSCVGVWYSRADTRRETGSAAYTALAGRVSAVESTVTEHLDWADKEDQRLIDGIAGVRGEVHELRRELVTVRVMQAEIGAVSRENNELLRELLRRAPVGR